MAAIFVIINTIRASIVDTRHAPAVVDNNPHQHHDGITSTRQQRASSVNTRQAPAIINTRPQQRGSSIIINTRVDDGINNTRQQQRASISINIGAEARGGEGGAETRVAAPSIINASLPPQRQPRGPRARAREGRPRASRLCSYRGTSLESSCRRAETRRHRWSRFGGSISTSRGERRGGGWGSPPGSSTPW